MAQHFKQISEPLQNFVNGVQELAELIDQKCNAFKNATHVENHDFYDSDLNITDKRLSEVASYLYYSRRFREDLIEHKGLFSDPAWDILLDLFLAHAREKNISISSATIGAHVPATTALRWLLQLEQINLIERTADTHDRRRQFVILTHEGLKFMRKALTYFVEKNPFTHN